jgi:hypothetical protein
MNAASLLAILALPCALAAQSLRLSMEDANDSAVPAAFVYDPLAKTSAGNSKSQRFSGGDEPAQIAKLGSTTGSFAIEAFVKLSKAADASFVKKARRDDKAAEAGLKLAYYQQHNQFYLRWYATPAARASAAAARRSGRSVFKTEYESQKLLAKSNSATELLGAFIDPIGKIPENRPIFENRDSRMALVYGTSVYGSNHKLHIRDARGAETKQLGNDALKWAGSRARMDLFVSDP